jgi:hypothetical protein
VGTHFPTDGPPWRREVLRAAAEFRLEPANASTTRNSRTIRHALEQLSAKGCVRKADDEFVVEAEMEGASTRELHRTFLSALRGVEKRATLRAEWTSDDGTSERFVDYFLKKTIKN